MSQFALGSSGTPLATVGSVILVATILLTAISPATGLSAGDAHSTEAGRSAANALPEIVAVYPNPATESDAGEFVVVRFPSETGLSGLALADDETTVGLPNETVSGRIAFSTDPGVARNRTDNRVLALSGGLAMANGGETVRLVRTGTGSTPAENVSAAAFEDAPEGERWHRVGGRNGGNDVPNASDGDWRWTPLGATDFEVARTTPDSARAFVLPDAPEVPVETLASADRRILLAGYTFTSPRVADELAAAARRGADVRVLVDDAPVGGITRRQAKLLDSLVARGVEVRVLGGPLARYRFHHPKYAVADDRALVVTENWKPSGTGGRASRGWGVELRDRETADHLAEIFAADAGWRDGLAWSEFRRGKHFETDPPANGSYSSRVAPRNVNVSESSLLVAPDNAEEGLIELLDSADESIRVQQVAIGNRDQSFLRASLRAAERGVEVRILLASAWYVEEDNRKLVEWLNERAEAEGLPLEARLADPQGRYEKIHAKGVVVDGEAAVVGSMNWNDNSARQNREVAVVLRGEEVGSYYAEVFDSDWEAGAGGGRGNFGRAPVGLLGAVAIGAVVAILYARREVTFE
ncbi:phospholipase [Halobacteriales archaeon SW_6_65_15]|nr:MAG: phospholipase [Halobacteriales archaeon SW_6_65_15]